MFFTYFLLTVQVSTASQKVNEKHSYIQALVALATDSTAEFRFKDIMKNNKGHVIREQILFNGSYFESLLADIKKAKQTIDLEVYIFSDDLLSKQIAKALVEAAARGVKVRILIDGAGSSPWGGSIARMMQKAGIATRIFHPFPWRLRQWSYANLPSTTFPRRMVQLLLRINSRNHRKTCMIDHKIIYVGSSNIAKCHLNRAQGGSDWRDTTVRLLNAHTKDLQYAFERAWNHVSIQERLRVTFHEVNTNPVLRLNYSLRARRILYKSLLLRIWHCKQRIWITNSYFIPDNFLLRRLIDAAKRGIDVRILLPHKSDLFIMSFIPTTFYTLLLKNGVRIYEYLPSVLHSKTLILDDWFSVGSYNLNFRSVRHDLEVDVNIRTAEAKAILEKQFLMDLEQSRQVGLEDMQKQSLLKRAMGRVLLFFRYYF